MKTLGNLETTRVARRSNPLVRAADGRGRRHDIDNTAFAARGHGKCPGRRLQESPQAAEERPRQPSWRLDSTLVRFRARDRQRRHRPRDTRQAQVNRIEENLWDREAIVDDTSQSLDAEIEETAPANGTRADVGDTAGKSGPGPARELDPLRSPAGTLPDVAVKREDVRSATSLERRAIGEQFRVLEPARVAERPIGPSRASVNVTGALAGLTFSTWRWSGEATVRERGRVVESSAWVIAWRRHPLCAHRRGCRASRCCPRGRRTRTS